MSYTGHALGHSLFFQLVMKLPVRILNASVAVKQRMGIWIGFYRLVKCFEYQWVVVTFAHNKGYDSPIIKVKDGAQVHFMHNKILIPLEFCHIGQPFLIGSIIMKVTGEQIFCDVLRILRTSGTVVAAVLNGGFYAFLPAYSKDALVIYMNTVVML